MSEKHTPGPWRVWQRKYVAGGDGSPVVNLGHPDNEQAEANAALIASAPDLLRHLALILEVGERNDYETYRAAVREIARAALAKAEGRG